MDTMSSSLSNADISLILKEDTNGHGINVFLEKIELAKYQQIFHDQEIDLKLLLTLGDEDLQQLGIKAFGPRRKIVNATTAIRSVLNQNTNKIPSIRLNSVDVREK